MTEILLHCLITTTVCKNHKLTPAFLLHALLSLFLSQSGLLFLLVLSTLVKVLDHHTYKHVEHEEADDQQEGDEVQKHPGIMIPYRLQREKKEEQRNRYKVVTLINQRGKYSCVHIFFKLSLEYSCVHQHSNIYTKYIILYAILDLHILFILFFCGNAGVKMLASSCHLFCCISISN